MLFALLPQRLKVHGGCADRGSEMSVDYRLLARFQASRERHDAARRSLPEQWRSDSRPEVQHANELWVSVVARAREHQDRLAAGHPPDALVWPSEDR